MAPLENELEGGGRPPIPKVTPLIIVISAQNDHNHTDQTEYVVHNKKNKNLFSFQT